MSGSALHFLRPAWLLLLPLLWALCLWLARRRAQAGDWRGVIDPLLLQGLQLSGAVAARTRDLSPWPWLAVAWSLAVIALAGPVWRQDQAPAFRAPANWVLVLDLSSSMNVADVAPTRVARARYVLDDVLAAAHDARVGLVVFSDDAYTVAPLTEDVATVHALLAPLAPDLMPSQGDALAPALARAGSLLQTQAGGERRMVVLTDGFQDPAAALAAASHWHDAGVSIDVIGIGTPDGAPLPTANGTFTQDASGVTRMSRLDETMLRQLANAGGGHYLQLSQVPSWAKALSQRTTAATAEADGANVGGDKPQARVARWRDEGIWLLPLLVLMAAGCARRGWVL